MNDMKNAYETLNMKTNASQEEIKKAFRTLAHIHHPDKGGNAEKFKEVNRAYSEINTPEKQRSYDAQIGVGARPTTSNPTYSWNMNSYQSQRTGNEEVLKEMLRQKMKSHFGEQEQKQYAQNRNYVDPRTGKWTFGIPPT